MKNSSSSSTAPAVGPGSKATIMTQQTSEASSPPSPPAGPVGLAEFGRFHALTCAVGFLVMLFSTLVTLSGMFLNVLPYNCTAVQLQMQLAQQQHQQQQLENASSTEQLELEAAAAAAAEASAAELPWAEHQDFRSSLSVQYRLCNQATGDLTNVAFFVGTIFGSLITGPTSDLIGRLRCTLIGQAVLCLASLGSNYAPSLWLHLASRCLAGCFMVFAQCAIQVYGCELHSSEYRGRFIAAWSTGISVGTLAAGALAHLTRHHQLFVLASCATALAPLALSACLPESPVWLAARGRAKLAEAAMRRIDAINGRPDASGDAAACAAALRLHSAAAEDADSGDERRRRGGCRWWFRVLLRPASVLGLHGVCLGLNCIGFYFVLSKVIPDVCLYAVLLGVSQLPYAFVLNLVPRRPGLIACGFVSGFVCLAFGGVAHFLPGQAVLLAGLGVVGCFCSSAAFSLLVAISTEFFPTAVRSTGLGLCIFCLRSGSAIAPLVNFLPGAAPQSLALACPLLLSNLVIGLALVSRRGTAAAATAWSSDVEEQQQQQKEQEALQDAEKNLMEHRHHQQDEPPGPQETKR